MKFIIDYFKKYPYVAVMLIIVVIWGTINTINADKSQQWLDREGKYTIATIIDIQGARSGRWVSVKFLYNGHDHICERRNERIPLTWIGEKIFVKFLPSNPENCEFYDFIGVPDSIKSFNKVWDSLPVKMSN